MIEVYSKSLNNQFQKQASVLRHKSLYIEYLENCHSRGSNRESSVFKKQRILDSRLRTAGMTAQATQNICKEALAALH
jgi:hypothetical protein